jgi:hemerythrin
MDRLHYALTEALEELSTIEDFRFAGAFREFLAKLEQYFRLEEAWLEKTQRPSVLMHLEGHARALSALHHVHSRVMAGEISEGRNVVQNVLPQWLAFHMATMEPALTCSLEQMDAATDAESFLTEESGFRIPH